MNRYIVIYPGRFQPFGLHHKAVFDFLELKFGKGNVFITTSNKTNSIDSPLDFELKKRIAVRMGIPSNRFIYTVNPYRADELRNYFNSMSDVLIYVYSEKDADRISYTRKDGSPGYFQPLSDDFSKCNSFDKNAYIFVAPKVSIIFNGSELSGTSLRSYLKRASKQEFENQLGFFDEELYNIFRTFDEPEITSDDSNIPSEYMDSKLVYYQQYIQNLLPSTFKVDLLDGKLVVSSVETLNEIILKLKDGRYRVYSKKLSPGKDGKMHRRNMGTYNTKKAAVAREEQIKDYMASINPSPEDTGAEKQVKKENKIVKTYIEKVDQSFWQPIFNQIVND